MAPVWTPVVGAVFGAVVGVLLATLLNWIKRKRALRTSWRTLRSEINCCHNLAVGYLKDTTPTMPLTRFPSTMYFESIKIIISEGDIEQTLLLHGALAPSVDWFCCSCFGKNFARFSLRARRPPIESRAGLCGERFGLLLRLCDRLRADAARSCARGHAHLPS